MIVEEPAGGKKRRIELITLLRVVGKLRVVRPQSEAAVCLPAQRYVFSAVDITGHSGNWGFFFEKIVIAIRFRGVFAKFRIAIINRDPV
jgi:hypothetical protein